MKYEQITDWLLQGDVSIRYQVHRDLLLDNQVNLRERIATEGWGKAFLSNRKPNGHWGLKFYQPKWTSTNYTLQDLRNLCISPDIALIHDSVNLIADYEQGHDGGINPKGSVRNSDVCINGMFLNYASYFKIKEEKLKSVVDFILSQTMPDGGFNCTLNRSGAVHSSLHTTLTVLEGITEYQKNGYTYRLEELLKRKESSIEFMLIHQLYISDKTGNIIKKDFLRLSYPGRWRYDILKALDYLQYEGIPWDERLKPAINILLEKRNRQNTWNTQAHHPGVVHFEMEKAGKPGRWNTLRALRVLKYFKLLEI